MQNIYTTFIRKTPYHKWTLFHFITKPNRNIPQIHVPYNLKIRHHSLPLRCGALYFKS